MNAAALLGTEGAEQPLAGLVLDVAWDKEQSQQNYTHAFEREIICFESAVVDFIWVFNGFYPFWVERGNVIHALLNCKEVVRIRTRCSGLQPEVLGKPAGSCCRSHPVLLLLPGLGHLATRDF